ncbi:MAG: flagellar filament capping protein FliD [Pontixanthobacter sp.]
MESTSTSSIIGALGSGSGVDMVQLARNLADARFAARIGQLEAKSELLETRISAASALRSQLSQLSAAFGDRVRNGDLAPKVTIGDPSVANISVASGASTQGSYTLEVQQLAGAQTLAGKAYPNAADPVGEGTLTIRFGTVNGGAFSADPDRQAVAIAVGASDSLNDVAASITASGAGLSAYVANGPNGAQLVVKGADGSANGFIIAGTGPSESGSDIFGNSNPAGPGNINYLDWSPNADSGQLRQTAQDARFTFDTIAMTSASNRIGDLPGGLNVTLTGTNAGAPTRIAFAQDGGAITGVMTDFVAALNDISGILREAADPLNGELGSDSGARRLKRELAGLSGTIVMPNAEEGEPRTLGDLGLAINRDGTFRLDNDRLNAALRDNSAAANAMFTTGLFGVFATLDKLSRAMGTIGDPGSLAGSVARYTKSTQKIDDQLAKIAEQQDALRIRLTKQFAQTDRNVAASQSTLSFLQNQIAAWNADRN